MTNNELKELLKKFFYYLDMEEESESGHRFRPTIITSCRVETQEALEKVIQELKAEVAHLEHTN